jgi:alkylhydroperoxidase family enzyme
LRQDYTKAAISEQDRALLDYVVKLTKDATQCSPDDHDRLRSVGFDDRGILQITLIASWFNYINRVADALGVGRDRGVDLLLRQPKEAEVFPPAGKT